jgi:hypothetical protein
MGAKWVKTICSMERKYKNIQITLIAIFLFQCYSVAQPGPQVFPVIKDQVEIPEVRDRASAEVLIPPDLQDFSNFLGISARIANTGSSSCRVEGFINGQRWINNCVYLEPGEMKTMEVLIKRLPGKGTEDFPAMNGLPGGSLWHWQAVDPAKIEKVTFMVFADEGLSVKIANVRPFGDFTPPEKYAGKEDFFPFIDQLGQYKYDDWPGKTNEELDLKKRHQAEQEELSLVPGPENRSRFGGWSGGGKLEATGHFRVEKAEGKWWLIDPDGHLFWSHGLTCVRFSSASTRISNREHFFEDIPFENEPFNEFLVKSNDETLFDFSRANLYRKYGEGWKEKSTINALRRLKSWGINSFGNWSDQDIYLFPEHRIPYTVDISPRWPKLDGRDKKFPDVFNPAFQTAVAEAMQNKGDRMKDDPYCIGYFVDNELSVSGLTISLMQQNPAGAAKQAFIRYLKNRYGSIRKLNRQWKTRYTGWRGFLRARELPNTAMDDASEFELQILDRYHSICREEVKKVAPDKLYLGSRLHCHYYPDDRSEVELIRIAARYCDVVTFNRYRFSAADLILPEDIDRPIIIGEFHFGALDRGHFHTGLRSVANQQQRAEAYYQYVKGALENPQIVGTHWFQYSDQAFTGRFDGENYQIGFIDICDNPYPEIVAAARKIGYHMYKLRSESTK